MTDINSAVHATAAKIIANADIAREQLIAAEHDVACAVRTAEIVDLAVERFGGLDLAVANAGIGGVEVDLVDLNTEDFEHIVDVNYRGVFLTCKYAGRVMREQGSGSIITVSSIFGQEPYPRVAAYSGSKAAVIAMTQAFALEMAPYKVRVNTIAPGYMATEMQWAGLRQRAAHAGISFEQERQRVWDLVPLGRAWHAGRDGRLGGVSRFGRSRLHHRRDNRPGWRRRAPIGGDMRGELTRALDRLMDGVRADWALYVKYTGAGEEICLNADTLMDSMSTIKIPVLVTLYRMVDSGELDLAQTFPLETRFKRFGTGVLQYMDDGMIFSLRDAATLMIIESDNTATDYCYEAVGGPAVVNATMQELGFSDIEVLGDCFDWFFRLGPRDRPRAGRARTG